MKYEKLESIYDQMNSIDDEASLNKVSMKMHEGLFDSKADKQKAYNKAIDSVFGKTAMPLANEIILNSIGALFACAQERDTNPKVLKTIESYIDKFASNVKQDSTMTLYHLISLCNKYQYNNPSPEFERLKEINSKMSKLTDVPKIGHKAKEYLFSLVNKGLEPKLKSAMKKIEQDARDYLN